MRAQATKSVAYYKLNTFFSCFSDFVLSSKIRMKWNERSVTLKQKLLGKVKFFHLYFGPETLSSLYLSSSVTRLGDIFKFWVTNVSSKAAKIYFETWAILKNIILSLKTTLTTFWQLFGNIGLFSFNRLVTLLSSDKNRAFLHLKCSCRRLRPDF